MTIHHIEPFLSPGNHFTVAGQYEDMKNPNRKWWQFWKPKIVKSKKLKVFTVAPPNLPNCRCVTLSIPTK